MKHSWDVDLVVVLSWSRYLARKPFVFFESSFIIFFGQKTHCCKCKCHCSFLDLGKMYIQVCKSLKKSKPNGYCKLWECLPVQKKTKTNGALGSIVNHILYPFLLQFTLFWAMKNRWCCSFWVRVLICRPAKTFQTDANSMSERYKSTMENQTGTCYSAGQRLSLWLLNFKQFTTIVVHTYQTFQT